MAFKDANGRITIDEAAAQKDIANIRAAAEHLETTVSLLAQMTNQAALFSGDSAKAITEVCINLKNQISTMIELSGKTTYFVESIVKKYEQIDRDLKKLIDGYTNNQR